MLIFLVSVATGLFAKTHRQALIVGCACTASDALAKLGEWVPYDFPNETKLRIVLSTAVETTAIFALGYILGRGLRALWNELREKQR